MPQLRQPPDTQVLFLGDTGKNLMRLLTRQPFDAVEMNPIHLFISYSINHLVGVTQFKIVMVMMQRESLIKNLCTLFARQTDRFLASDDREMLTWLYLLFIFSVSLPSDLFIYFYKLLIFKHTYNHRPLLAACLHIFLLQSIPLPHDLGEKNYLICRISRSLPTAVATPSKCGLMEGFDGRALYGIALLICILCQHMYTLLGEVVCLLVKCWVGGFQNVVFNLFTNKIIFIIVVGAAEGGREGGRGKHGENMM